MNKKYETAELTIIEFGENDIIVTSIGEEHILASNDAMEEE